MKVLKILLTLVLVIGVLGGAAYAGGRLLNDHDQRAVASSGNLPGGPSSSTPSSPTSHRPRRAPARRARQPTHHAQADADVLKPGAKGTQVRELQQRLFQLAWLPETTTGEYDATTVAAVKGFQGKHGLHRTGVLDATTWKQLRAMTTTPTHDAMFNVLHAASHSSDPATAATTYVRSRRG